jgi:chromosome partitioning protein
MLVQSIQGSPQSAHVVVLGNEKGGSGKSTTALHIAVALLKAGQRVATIDLDSRQKSFTHYIENRRHWAERARIDLELPTHHCVDRADGPSVEANEAREFDSFAKAISTIEHTRRGGDRHARQRHLSDAARPLDGRYAGHAAQ